MKGVEALSIRDVAGGSVLAVKVVPGSARDRIAGVLGNAVKVTTGAAPEKGKANAAVARMLAGALGLGRRDVTLHAHPTSPRKEFFLAGLSAAEARRRLAAWPN